MKTSLALLIAANNMSTSLDRAQSQYDAQLPPSCFEREPEPTPAELLSARMRSAVAAANALGLSVEVDKCDWHPVHESVALDLLFWEFQDAEQLGRALVAMGQELLGVDLVEALRHCLPMAERAMRMEIGHSQTPELQRARAALVKVIGAAA